MTIMTSYIQSSQWGLLLVYPASDVPLFNTVV